MKEKLRLILCGVGCLILIAFLITSAYSAVYILRGWFGKLDWIGSLKEETWRWLVLTLKVVVIEAIVFWVGIIIIYLTGTQLGIRYRVWGLLLGWIPIANIVMLCIMLYVCIREIITESCRIARNGKREQEKLCDTKYPVLLVHGVFFRDFKNFNYWGRIPDELEKNGARIFYGNHRSAAAVRDSAVEIKVRIEQILKETGCEKVNIIAHSKGGLDSRAAISLQGMAPYVASLTTINTPHRGCEFADYLLEKIPEKQKNQVAAKYNAAATLLGDKNPDFLAAVYDLTHEKCATFNDEVKDAAGVFYQSVGSKINRILSGRFPLNLSYCLVQMFDGNNDGLVGEESFPWGEKYEFLTTPDSRGISHGDVIDLNRENRKHFDVREFYVQLVADLKKRGL